MGFWFNTFWWKGGIKHFSEEILSLRTTSFTRSESSGFHADWYRCERTVFPYQMLLLQMQSTKGSLQGNDLYLPKMDWYKIHFRTEGIKNYLVNFTNFIYRIQFSVPHVYTSKVSELSPLPWCLVEGFSLIWFMNMTVLHLHSICNQLQFPLCILKRTEKEFFYN